MKPNKVPKRYSCHFFFNCNDALEGQVCEMIIVCNLKRMHFVSLQRKQMLQPLKNLSQVLEFALPLVYLLCFASFVFFRRHLWIIIGKITF